MPKFFRCMSSSIEEGIIASFCDIVFEKETLSGDDSLVIVRKYVKRGFDLFVSSILLIMCLPVFLVITLAIKISSRGPVFFKQERVGYRGKVFKIKKFRTMRQESSEEEHRQYVQYLLREGSERGDRITLLANYIAYVDGKITKVGKFLRATSLDELPQLINIFVGDMSLVGPRPHPVYEVKEYKKWYRRRLCVKPGLTGWSKLKLRCTPMNYEEAILYDLWYVDHWNLSLDLRILLMTIPYVLLMQDAH